MRNQEQATHHVTFVRRDRVSSRHASIGGIPGHLRGPRTRKKPQVPLPVGPRRKREPITERQSASADGGAGTHTLRTSFWLKLVLGLPYYQHNLPPFVAEPFQFSLKSTSQGGLTEGIPQQDRETARHPIWRVFDWQRRLDEDKALTKVQIGEQEGLSKARMTQMFSLLHLPKDAQDYLADLTAPALIRAFSVRQLMGVAKTPAPERVEAFQRMRADCERHGLSS